MPLDSTNLRESILQALRQVDDPDLKQDIVTLNMVQDLAIEGNQVRFRLVLTTPACPLKDTIKNACLTAIKHLVSPELEVEVIFDSMVTSQLRDSANKLHQVKNVIAIASGKGGVGKSTIAANLALALAATGAKVGLLDADIYGPSVPILFDIQSERPAVRQEGQRLVMQPIVAHGIELMSIGLLVDPTQALAWRGPMITTALKQLVMDVEWGALDYLLIDMPPGTGDIYLTLAQQFPLGAAVIVTTPQPVALLDSQKSMEMFRMKGIDIPILGLVENMAWFTPEDNPDRKYYIFGKDGASLLAGQYNIPVLAQVPLQEAPFSPHQLPTLAMLSQDHPHHNIYMQLAGQVARTLAIANATPASN